MVLTLLLTAVLTIAAISFYVYTRALDYVAKHPLSPPSDFEDRVAEWKAARDAAATTALAKESWMVIGGGGYVGQRVVKLLLERHSTVKVFDLALPRHLQQDSRVVFTKGNILDTAALVNALGGVTHVVYLASLVSVDVFAHAQLKLVNIDGCASVLEAVYKVPSVRSLVYTSSLSRVGDHYTFPKMWMLPCWPHCTLQSLLQERSLNAWISA